MTGFVNPLAPKRNLPARTAEIKGWVRERFRLPDDLVVAVTELACREEGCPDIETVIGIMRPGEKVETLRLHKPIDQIEEDDIAELAAEVDAEVRRP
jgi:hypothetical protein